MLSAASDAEANWSDNIMRTIDTTNKTFWKSIQVQILQFPFYEKWKYTTNEIFWKSMQAQYTPVQKRKRVDNGEIRTHALKEQWISNPSP